jgi:hypothetical protein
MTMEAPKVPVEKLVKVYLKMKAKKTEIDAAYKTEMDALEEKMRAVKRAMLEYCKEHNLDSVKLADGSGMFYRTVKQNYWTNDWESMGRFIVEHKIPELLEKRIHQGNMRQFLEENPELLPPGLNVDSEYTITVRRK